MIIQCAYGVGATRRLTFDLWQSIHLIIMPVYLLRHGESAHNVQIKKYMDENPESHVLEWWEIEDRFDPGIRDADLTEVGIKQAQEVRERVNTISPTLLLMSPLSRNLRTGLESCTDLLKNDSDIKRLEVVITPALREHTYSTCDLGSQVEQLRLCFPSWDEELNDVPVDWWCHDPSGDVNSRLDCRESWQKLQDRAEVLSGIIKRYQEQHENIVVVGHAVLFYALTGKWLSNCQIMEINMENLRLRCDCVTPGCSCDC